MIRILLLSVALFWGMVRVLPVATANPVTPEGAVAVAAIGEGQMLQGRFTQERVLNGFARPMVSEGRFVLYPEHGLIWRTEKPFAITLVMTQSSLLQLVEGRESLRLSIAQMPFLSQVHDLMSGALRGDWDALKQAFEVRVNGYQVILTPRAAADVSGVQQITARINRFVSEVQIDKPQGDRDHLVFHDQVIVTTGLAAEDAALFARAQ